jgi:hypothetical protein
MCFLERTAIETKINIKLNQENKFLIFLTYYIETREIQTQTKALSK